MRCWIILENPRSKSFKVCYRWWKIDQNFQWYKEFSKRELLSLEIPAEPYSKLDMINTTQKTTQTEVFLPPKVLGYKGYSMGCRWPNETGKIEENPDHSDHSVNMQTKFEFTWNLFAGLKIVLVLLAALGVVNIFAAMEWVKILFEEPKNKAVFSLDALQALPRHIGFLTNILTHSVAVTICSTPTSAYRAKMVCLHLSEKSPIGQNLFIFSLKSLEHISFLFIL